MARASGSAVSSGRSPFANHPPPHYAKGVVVSLPTAHGLRAVADATSEAPEMCEPYLEMLRRRKRRRTPSVRREESKLLAMASDLQAMASNLE